MTGGSASALSSVAHFNSHPREGGDLYYHQRPRNAIISIPTPARGVTVKELVISFGANISIPTPARGVTRQCRCFWNFPRNFNSHPREGGDQNWRPGKGHCTDFNSHPREGGDKGGRVFYRRHCISIPTPARGVTVDGRLQVRSYEISIPTPARGVTCPLHHLRRNGLRISIPTPARGVTSSGRTRPLQIPLFQFPPPRGG